MTHLRLLLSALLLSALSACAADADDPELDIAAIDRGSVSLYGIGAEGRDEHWLDDDMGVLLVANSYDNTWEHGRAQFRVYTQDRGLWADVHLEAICTDGNKVEAQRSGFVSSNYWMFATVECPSPYSVSESYALIHLDY